MESCGGSHFLGRALQEQGHQVRLSVFDMAGHFHSDALHVVERFTLADADTMSYEATLEDPKVFTRPVKLGFPLKRAPEDYELIESGCFEGERDQVHLPEGVATLPEGHYKK
jgi:hypothetical protein